MDNLKIGGIDLGRSFAERVRSLDIVRCILVGGTVAVFVTALGLVLYFQRPAGRNTGAPEQIASVQPTPRLPRPRPMEPMTTGSIALAPAPRARSRDQTPPPVQEARLPSPEPSARPQASPEMPATIASLDVLHSRAVVVASAKPDCDQVLGSEALESRDGPTRHPVFLVDCANGTRLYLDGSELSEAPAEVPDPAASPQFSDVQAIGACEEKVRNGLAVPGSLQREAATTGVLRDGGGDAIVTFDFDAENGFGYPLALQAECVFEEREIARVDVTSR